MIGNNYKNILVRVRKLVNKIRYSLQLRRSLKQQSKVLDIKDNMLYLDNNTRWNSTLIMLNSIIKLRQPIRNLIAKFPELSSYYLSTADFTILANIANILALFEKPTIKL